MDRYVIDQIRQATSISELLSAYAKPGRSTKTFCCPFHEDKSPSLSVSNEKNLWFCHAGCGGGDCFDFIRKMNQCSFYEAAVYLANRVGIRSESRITEEELWRIKERNERVQEEIREVNYLESQCKQFEREAIDSLRRLYYQLPQNQSNIVYLNAKAYSHGAMKEHELDLVFEEIMKIIDERKKHFFEMRRAIYRKDINNER